MIKLTSIKKGVENYRKNKTCKRKEFNFKVGSINNRPAFLQMVSFHNTVVNPAAIENGNLIGLIKSHKTRYHSLMKR